MARSTFGGTTADTVAQRVRILGHDVDDYDAATLTVWSAATGGTQYTDLLVNGGASSSVPVDSTGQIPEFQGPDGVAIVWVDAGAARVKMLPSEGPGDSTVAAAVSGGPQTQAAMRSREASPKLYHLDTYANFFRDPAYIFVTGQGNTATTASASAAVGATTIDVASVTGLSAGVVIITGAGTAQMQQRKIGSITGTTLTLDAALTYAVSSGDTVSPLWTDDRHLTTEGWKAFAYFIANAKDSSGNYIITGTSPKVTYLGDSWIAYGGSQYATQLQARIPGATVVNAGVGGDESDLLLARFDTDVPPDSDYVVINEPGVNDTTAGYSAATMAANLESLWRKARAIGATLVFTGLVPLQPATTAATARHSDMVALLGDGSSFPSVTPSALKATYAAVSTTAPNSTSVAVGSGALGAVPSGTSNTAIGYNAGLALTSGLGNTAIGYTALAAAVTTNQSVAVGSGALRFATGAGSDVAVGFNAANAQTTGSGNVIIGHEAGHNVAGATTDQTTTGSLGVIIGKQAGGNTSNQVAIGYYAKATAQGAIALGSNTVAAFSGSVAIGRDNTGTGASSSASNEIALGTVNHTTRLAGYLRIDRGQTTVGAAGAASALPATPTKYLSVKDSTGTEYVFPVYAKA